MSGEELIPVGTVVRSRGLSGELVISLSSQNIEIEKRTGKVWLGDNADHINPWDVDFLRIVGKRAFLKLRSVHSREEADYLKGIKVFLPVNQVKTTNLCGMIGFKVKVYTSGELKGSVVDIDYSNPQPLMIIRTDSGEVLIPAIERFIKDIDWENRVVFVEIIEGLFPE